MKLRILSKSAAALPEPEPPGKGWLGKFLHGDGQGVDARYGILGSAMVEAPTHLFNGLYGNAIMSHTPNVADEDLFLKLKSMAEQKGVKVTEDAGPPQYNSATKTINATTRNPGIMAHELGHTPQSPKSMLTANFMKLLSGFGGAGALLSPDEEMSRNFGVAGSASYAPLLGLELGASARGYKHLRELGVGRLKSLSAGKGLPTYLAAAAMPWLMHKMKKGLGGFEPIPQPQ